MKTEEHLSKKNVVILIRFLKIVPMLLAICESINSVLYFLNIDIPALSYIGGISFIPLLFIYISSWTYKFCSYHRMFLYYVAVINIINIIDFTYNIPISNLSMLSIHAAITAIFLFIILYLYRKEKLCYKQ